MPANKLYVRGLADSFLKAFNFEFCKDLSDSLWKNRGAWVEKQAAKVPAGSKVLDVGAGACQYKPLFKDCEYTAQDFAQTPNMTYGQIDVVSDITKIPLKSDSYDVVLCSEVFEHIPYPEKALQEIVRLMKPGGKLIFSAPLGSGQHQQPYHYFGGYTRFWYEKFFPENGLRIDSLTPNGGLYGHITEMLWRSQPSVLEFTRSRGLLGKLLAYWLQIIVYNIPTIVLWKFEKKTTIEDFTVCFLVTATKKRKSK